MQGDFHPVGAVVELISQLIHALLQQVREAKLNLPDTDCDTGRETSAAEYELADETYGRLLHDLSESNFSQLTAALQSNVLAFYSNLGAPFHTKKDRKRWSETEREVQQLRSWRQSTEPAFPVPMK